MNKKSLTLLFLTMLLFIISAVSCSLSEKEVPVTSVQFLKTEYDFSETGQTFQLAAVVKPDDATSKKLLWSSSDEKVAVVTQYGLVTAVNDGEAYIYARSEGSEAFASCKITVTTYVDVTGISLTESSHEFTYFGEIMSLGCEVLPSNATEPEVLWSSSNPLVATVDSNGTVISVSNGEAIITARTVKGNFAAFCEVNVNVDINVPMTDVNFDISEYTFTTFDENIRLTPVWEPENTTERGLEWIVSDKSVVTVTVDGSTGIVTPVGNGEATVYAVSDNRKKQAICKVKVDAVIPAEKITLSETSVVFDEKGETYTISYTLSPKNTTDRSVVFISDNPDVATVDGSGKVTAVSNGNAKINIFAAGGNIKTVVDVKVDIPQNVAVTGVSFSSESYVFAKTGDSLTLSWTVSPSAAANKNVTFVSSAPDIVSVDNNGKITALSEGTAIITVTTQDGGFTANFTATVEKQEEQTIIPPSEEIVIGAASDGLKGLWVATVSNIDFPSKPGLSAAELRAEIDTIVNNAYEWGFNAIFLQVRPKSDAVYYSSIFPSSDCIVEKQGDKLPLDCLEYFITAAHSRGIELHAWVNPYRITQSGQVGHNLSQLAESNPARIHPEWVVKHSDGAAYYNPGIPEVRKLIIDGILEIVNNYNIDGIHFDDYFYPYNDSSKFADSKEYEKYKTEGQSLADWRRSNNDALVSQTAAAIKAAKSSVAFGISPSGVWALKTNNSLGTDIKSSSESYYQVYADTRKWVLNEWIDYICPQIYWEIGHSTAPFKPITDWWNDLVSQTKVKLYVGIAAYKGASVAAYKSPSEIQNQLKYLNTKDHVSGVVFFSYKDVAKNLAGIRDTAKTYFKSGSEGVEAATDKLVLSYSSLTVESTTSKTFIIGVSDPNYPLYIAGEEVTTRSPKGYFTHMVSVPKTGENHYKIEHKGETVDYIIKKSGSYSEPKTMSSFGFVSGTCAPKYDRAEKSGTTINFSCTATAGAKVYVVIGDYTVDLSTTDKDSTDGSFRRAWYEGSFVLPDIDGNAVLGNPEFVIEKNGYDTVRYKGSNTIEVINDPESYVVEFIGDFPAQLKPDLKVTGEDFRYATIGALDTVVSKYNGNVLLGSGYYTVTDNIKKADNSSIPYSAIGKISVTQSQDGKYTNVVIPTDAKTMNTVWMSDTKADITLFNLSALPADFSLPDNPLFKEASVSRVNSTTARISLTYKKELYIFGYTAYFENGALIIAFKNPVSLYDSNNYPLYGIRISLDPGHSLNGGALGPWGRIKWTEADWNYELSRLVETRLINLGATVYLTHHRELEKDLDPLILEYRAWKPDINVSIHFNYVGETANPLNTSGTVTYYSYTSSKLLAKVMLDEFTEATGLKKNSYKIGYYKVSMFPDFPSILFETAFMSNIYDYEWFTDEANMEKAADAIVMGIVEYFSVQS